MSFTVTFDVPETFNWSPIRENYVSYLEQVGVLNGSDDLADHFAYLVRATSWSYGIDWDVKAGEVTFEMPFSGALSSLSTKEDSVDTENGVSIDGMSRVLKAVLDNVPPKRVQSHFKQFKLSEPDNSRRPSTWRQRPFSSGLYDG